MTLVRLINADTAIASMRNTPGHRGEWEGITFTTSETACDYSVVLNQVYENIVIVCPPRHVWAIIQEPPDAKTAHLQAGPTGVYQVFTPDESRSSARFVPSHPALGWSSRLAMDYDSLCTFTPPEKPRLLSWVTSNKAFYAGHQTRLAFLARIRNTVPFDLYGEGFAPIADKWEALAPYRYALAIENYRNSYYWTEKIADCFLAWTMPIYYGCSEITRYFPPEALCCIDIHDPHVDRTINEILASDRWERHREAIAYARDLVLHRYQLFPFITDQIRQHAPCTDACRSAQVTIYPHSLVRRWMGPSFQRLCRKVKRWYAGA